MSAPEGPEGLVHGKTVYIVSTRGGAYSAAPQMDFQEAYLRQVLGFIGISDVRFVRAEGLNMGAEPRAAALASANEDIDRATAVALPLGDRKAA